MTVLLDMNVEFAGGWTRGDVIQIHQAQLNVLQDHLARTDNSHTEIKALISRQEQTIVALELGCTRADWTRLCAKV